MAGMQSVMWSYVHIFEEHVVICCTVVLETDASSVCHSLNFRKVALFA